MSITVLTAYDFNTARALTEAGVDMILVGDSLAMVALGYENTTLVSVEEMLICTAAVARGVQHCHPERSEGSQCKRPAIIADLPYSAIYRHCEERSDEAIHYSVTEIVTTCKRFIAAGADIIKIENARPLSIEIIKALRAADIRVMGHIGYTPQDIELFAKSKIIRDASVLMQDARALVEAGVESMVLEMVPYEIARDITAAVNNGTTAIGLGQGVCERGAGVDIRVNEDAERANNAEISQLRKSRVPTIGIGSGPYTTGQVLVTDDMLGRYNLINPKFLRRYAQQYDETVTAIQAYIKDVQAGDFPRLEESYS